MSTSPAASQIAPTRTTPPPSPSAPPSETGLDLHIQATNPDPHAEAAPDRHGESPGASVRSAAAQDPDSPLAHLSSEQIEQLGRELDGIHDEVYADLGERDAKYIRNTIKFHRYLVLGARAMLLGSRKRSFWLGGTAALSVAKILENMEIGHNVMHGQWDWMNDPDINSKNWDWDTASPADAWRHSHNYEHHTFTNIRGKDRDLGYEIMRIDTHQPWHPVYLFQPLYNLILMGFFEWGVALHDLNFEAIKTGEKSKKQVVEELKAIGLKARRQAVKDYVAFPLLSASAAAMATGKKDIRPAFKATVAANFTANIVRNVWAHSIIFCGHFPDQTYTFSEREVENETRGAWYVRQLLGSANIEGGRLFHFMAGNLSFQVEHHLYPDMPSSRYAEIAPRVRDICERYGLPYNTGPLRKQLGSVHRTILRLALPGGKTRKKPGPSTADR
ncbi:MAG: acyl-CoA desaturase [Solirubrobacteraceae bacterium]